jgi:hypothetical protein
MWVISLAINVIVALITLIFLATYRGIFYILGIFVQPIAIHFAKEDRRDAKPFSQFPQHGIWYFRTAPKWLFPFGNERDGFLGDKRGWWANERKGDEESFISQYLWSAIRNPCNNMRFMPFSSCNVKESRIDLIAGQEYVRDKKGSEGWQFVRAIDKNNIPYYGFYFVKPRKDDPLKAIVIRIGFKIEPRHATEYKNSADEPYGAYYKGMTFRFSLDKDIS